MVLNQQNNNRILIYFFYDGDGVADDYVTYGLKGFRPYVNKIIFVANGALTLESRKKVEEIADQIIVRENEGFDGWAYKAGIDAEGWKKLEQYDELIMTNHTIMGPVESYGPMFCEMDGRDLDFWGVTKNRQIDYDITGCSKYGYIPEHIQSHFIAVRKPMLASKEFHKYWDEFPDISNYNEAIGLHEAIFTKHFADVGFKWDVYVCTAELDNMCDYHLLNMPVEMLKKGCPFFKRRSFFHDYGHFLEWSIGTASVRLMEYLDKDTSFDMDLIWDNILRTCNMEDIAKCLQLNYVLSTKFSDAAKTQDIGRRRKVALLMHLYFEDLFDEMYHYASSMPEYADVFITVSDERKKRILEDKFASLPVHKVEVILCNNRGRDVSAGLIEGKKLVAEYDYICFAHDKKTKQLKNGLSGQGFADRCFCSILYNRDLVANILNTFEENDRLGMLGTPFPNHGEYFNLYGNEWTMNYKNTKKLLAELGLKAPMDERKMPVTAYGSVFWFRADALKRLYEKDWKYEDFPEEPLPEDGTISHAIERVRPFVAQASGYYSAMVLSDIYAAIEYTNISHYLREYRAALSGMYAAAAGNDASMALGVNVQGNAAMILEMYRRQEAQKKYIEELEWRVTPKGFLIRILRRIFPFLRNKGA